MPEFKRRNLFRDEKRERKKGKLRLQVVLLFDCILGCDCSPPVSSIYWILQARILEWVAMPFSRGFS